MNVTETFRGFSAQRSLPLDVERTETVRSGPSGSAAHAGLHAQAQVAVPLTLPLDVERTGCTPSHCHSTSSVRAARPYTATRRRAYQDGTLRAEWKCYPHGTARSGPSGSAAHTATRRRAYGLHALTLPLDVERTETVRPGPSGRATEAPVGGDCRPGGLPTTRVPRAQGVRREARGGPGGVTARGARETCARQEPLRVRPGPARRPRRCERCAEIDEYVAQK